jgi:hypothetical protein
VSGKTEGRLFAAPRFQGHVPARVWGFESPVGTRNHQAGVLLSLLGRRGLKREYFGSIAVPSSAGSMAVSFTSTLNSR